MVAQGHIPTPRNIYVIDMAVKRGNCVCFWIGKDKQVGGWLLLSVAGGCISSVTSRLKETE